MGMFADNLPTGKQVGVSSLEGSVQYTKREYKEMDIYMLLLKYA